MTRILDGVENLWAEDVTIKNAGSASDGVCPQGRALVGIFMPASWTAAQIGFDVSLDGINWVTAYDNGKILVQAGAAQGTFVAIPQDSAVFAPFLRVKSVDISDVAVAQGAARVLTLLFKRYLGGS